MGMSEETKEKLRKKALLRRHTPETKFKIGQSQLGKKRTERTRALISQATVRHHKKFGSYWLGKKQNKQTKLKRSLSLMGRVFSEETITKMSLAKKGKKWVGSSNPKWKGGCTKENIKIRTSPDYKRWRLSIFKRDGFSCVFCGTKQGPFNADHIKPFSRFPDLRFDLSNGRTLCEPCHRKTPTFGINLIRNEKLSKV